VAVKEHKQRKQLKETSIRIRVSKNDEEMLSYVSTTLNIPSSAVIRMLVKHEHDRLKKEEKT
jgi:hypothetical protein